MSAETVETLGTAVRRRAMAAPDHLALHLGERTLSYAQADRAASRVAAALRREGIAAGDVIAVLGTTSLPYVLLMIGAARADVVLALLPTSASGAAIAGMLADAGARALFTDAPDLLPEGTAPALVVDLADDAFDRWLPADAASLDQAPPDAEAPTTIIYSSGTTGVPKGILQPHRNRSELMRTAGLRGFDADAVSLLATPLYSNTTLSTLYSTLGVGGTAVLQAKFDAGAWLALAERWRVTHTMLVPVMYQRLLAHPDFDRTDLSHFRVKQCASAPFAAALKREVLDRWPGGLTEIYGLTESGALFILRAHEHPDKLHTVGHPAPGCEIRILDEQDRDVPTGQPGELVSRSPGMMVGYHNRSEETAATRWTDPAGRIWLRTGDIGQLDADGFMTIVGRKKDVIISGGFNIYPSDLESELAAHPLVEDASVIGVPSDTWGETPVAFVVARGVPAVALKDWVNARLGKMQRITEVVLIDQLPRNAIGKVQKNELRDRYVAQHAMAN